MDGSVKTFDFMGCFVAPSDGHHRCLVAAGKKLDDQRTVILATFYNFELELVHFNFKFDWSTLVKEVRTEMMEA